MAPDRGVDIPGCGGGAQIDEGAARQHDRGGERVGVDQPCAGSAGEQPPQDQHEAGRDQRHPDQRGQAQYRHRIGIDIIERAQCAGRDQQHILDDPQCHQPAYRRARRTGAARAERHQHEQPGEQRGDDQRIGPAMRIVRHRHARGQGRAAPQEGEVERVLDREDRVEGGERQDQRRATHLRQGQGGPRPVPAGAARIGAQRRPHRQQHDDRDHAAEQDDADIGQDHAGEGGFDQWIGLGEQRQEQRAAGDRQGQHGGDGAKAKAGAGTPSPRAGGKAEIADGQQQRAQPGPGKAQAPGDRGVEASPRQQCGEHDRDQEQQHGERAGIVDQCRHEQRGGGECDQSGTAAADGRPGRGQCDYPGECGGPQEGRRLVDQHFDEADHGGGRRDLGGQGGEAVRHASILCEGRGRDDGQASRRDGADGAEVVFGPCRSACRSAAVCKRVAHRVPPFDRFRANELKWIASGLIPGPLRRAVAQGPAQYRSDARRAGADHRASAGWRREVVERHGPARQQVDTCGHQQLLRGGERGHRDRLVEQGAGNLARAMIGAQARADRGKIRVHLGAAARDVARAERYGDAGIFGEIAVLLRRGIVRVAVAAVRGDEARHLGDMDEGEQFGIVRAVRRAVGQRARDGIVDPTDAGDHPLRRLGRAIGRSRDELRGAAQPAEHVGAEVGMVPHARQCAGVQHLEQ
ncbi:hypothetical protein WR25_08536 [Diploscapter pachys]|uniref:Uncharacterized protein n=1 Tax=Diploscapter pachys TaxID=2018661 RepID=A0A2A2K286_9BILA|nr:hypothetical protein WR25_08536 [Diploscapter pachys]